MSDAVWLAMLLWVLLVVACFSAFVVGGRIDE